MYVYLAGPYRGSDATAHDATVYHNIDAHINEAHRWASRLAEDGIFYFSPHLNSAHMEVTAPNASSAFWLELDFQFLQHAWGLFLLPGWRESEGAQAEKAFALAKPMPVFTHLLYDQMKEAYQTEVNNA
jgi:nucleoside 2-deoxyribosyltransferase